MKTTLTTPTFTITVTEISIDHDDPSRLELSFSADLTPAYLRSTEFANDDIDAFNDFYTDIADYADNELYFEYDFNVASRHADGLYYIIRSDRSGDSHSDTESLIFQFGQPVIDFIADTCRLLNVPFCAA